MSDSIIEQVKRLAEAQKNLAEAKPDGFSHFPIIRAVGQLNAAQNDLDAPALLAHLERTQAVVDAARKLSKHLNVVYGPVQHVSPTKALLAALDAALERMKP